MLGIAGGLLGESRGSCTLCRRRGHEYTSGLLPLPPAEYRRWLKERSVVYLLTCLSVVRLGDAGPFLQIIGQLARSACEQARICFASRLACLLVVMPGTLVHKAGYETMVWQVTLLRAEAVHNDEADIDMPLVHWGPRSARH